MDSKLDKSYDIQKHLTTLNTVSILITIALFDKLKEHIEPPVLFKVVKCFLFSIIFSLAHMFATVGRDMVREEAKGKFVKGIILAIISLTTILSWAAFIYGIILISLSIY